MTPRHHRSTVRLLLGLSIALAPFASYFALLAEPAAATRYVAPGGADGGNLCLDPAAPCATLRQAVARSAAGDTLRLSPGTYREAGLAVPHTLTILGDSAATVTIDGQSAGTVLAISAGATATIESLTIRGGLGQRGGAARVEAGGALILRRAVLRDNRADQGGAIYATDASTTIEDSQLVANTAAAGGAVYLDSGSLLLSRSVASGNRAGSGAGLFIGPWATATLDWASLSANIANTVGGGVYSQGSLLAANSVFLDNQAGVRGGGLFNDHGTADLDYTTWLGNAAPAGGALGGKGTTRLRASAVAGRHQCEHAVEGGSNLIADEGCGQPIRPPAGLEADGRLAFNSNAIDAGPTGLCTAAGRTLASDLRGQPRPADGDRDGIARCDLGAYEFQPRLTIIHSTNLADGARFDFRGDLGPFALTDPDRPRLVMEAAPGAYRLEQLREPGWKLNGIACAGDTDNGSAIDLPGRVATVDLDAGEAITCIFTSRPNRETIGVVVRGPAGSDPAVAFSGNLGQFELRPESRPDMRSGRLAAGSHAIQASPPAGWRVGAIQCAGDKDNGTTHDAAAGLVMVDLDAAETIGCAFTLLPAGTAGLTIRHETAPTGNAPFIFTGDLGLFALRSATSAARTLTPPPGAYRVHEVLHPAWRLSRLECAGDADGGSVLIPEEATALIDLDAGEAITCTFSHTRATTGTGSITIVQTATPADGTAFQYAGMLGEFSLAPPAAASRTFAPLRPGTYNVQQVLPAGWSLEAITCDGDADNGTTLLPDEVMALIDLDEGEDITCTYANARPASTGVITIVHEAIPAEATLFRYNGALGGFNLRAPQRPSRSFVDLAPGGYFVNARPQDGWSLYSISCEGDTDGGSALNIPGRNVTIDLDPGEAIVCRYLHLGQGVEPPTPTPGPSPTPSPSPTPPPGDQHQLYLPFVKR